MKKALLLLASAALLLVGCAKEKFTEPSDGGLTNVTISACIDGGVATRAVADNDGAGANVNRCIMEIYFNDVLYTRLVQPVTPASEDSKAFATFANVPVVAGKEYQVLFWADCGGTEKSDLYYMTTSLKAVTVAKTAFIDALEAGDNDNLDAFYFAGNYTVPQNPTQPFNVSLKRPFAQLNVITTDVAAGKTVFKEGLLPEKVSVSYEAANTINVATGEISKVGNNAEDYTFTYEADVYGDWSTVATKHELTLSMDYLLASTEQGAVDVTFITKNGDQAVMTHSLTNLPYKRNYRTNVKGDLLTTGGTWKAEIEPKWGNGTDTGEIDHIIASSYTDVVNALQSGNESQNMKVSVTPAAVNNLSDEEKAQVIVNETIDGESVKALKFILYEEKKSGEQVTQQASPKHVEFELPARPTGVAAWKIEYEQAYPTETVVVSTKEENDANVIIEAPKSTVTLEATKIHSVVSTTSENTLIIPQGLELTNLTVKKGAVEYHGKGLTKVTIAPLEGAKVSFKTSEGLANTLDVYGVVKGHVAEGFAITKETENTWKIVPAVCKIGETGYASLIDAVAAVQSGETINLLKDYEGDGVVVPGGKNFTLDFGGHTYKVIGNMAGSAGTKNQCFQLLKGSNLVFQNGTITTSCAKLGINTYSNLTVKNLTVDMSQTEATGQVACLETCNGTVSIEGESNLITKEDQIAVLSLYWPDGGYGDIDVTINTTGEVNGLMAYGSYQVQDLSTVAQHSHVAIKNGKYDVTFDMDELESYDYKISGGIFTNKPDESLVADKYEITENTDAATKDRYPWTVKISSEYVFVAKIGTTEYHTLSEALSAAKDGEAVYIIPAQLEETVSASNDNNIQLILDGKNIIGDITFGGKGTLIVRAEELNTDYYHASNAYEVYAPTIPAQGVGGIMGKISATETATVMLRENLYSGPFEGNVELRGGFYYSGLGLDNIKAQTPNGIGLVVEQSQEVQGYSMYYVPEVPESYLVHISAEFLAAGLAGDLTPEQIQQATLGYWLNEERLLNPMWVSLTEDGSISLDDCPKGFPDDVYAFFTNLKDNDSENPKYAYQNWVCDFVISYSQPIAEDYKSGIWGYYSEMGFGCWLPKSATNNPVGLMRSTFGPWAYSQMLSTVGMFLCGPKNLNPADAGKVITVELNIYPNSETDKCITTNKVVYTIPAISE